MRLPSALLVALPALGVRLPAARPAALPRTPTPPSVRCCVSSAH